MSFSNDLRRFAVKLATREKDVFLGTVSAVKESITEGSPITGSPGQPVDAGNLKGSWIESFPEDWFGEVATPVEYAPPIEAGVGPHGEITLRSEVGGFGSVAATTTNFDRLVEHVTRQVVGND